MENKYKGIVRDGFYVRPMMQRVWDCQLDIIREIDIICKRHAIKWYADWGTLLGAVRHKGYIPWDDDIDISMRRMDFERFKRFSKDELPAGYVRQMDRDKGLSDLVFRVKNTDKVNIDEDFLKKNHYCPYSVGVDIFVYDNIPDDLLEREQFVAMFTYTFAAAADPTADMLFHECTEETQNLIVESERMTGVKIDRTIPVKGQLIDLADRISAMYFDVDTKEVAQVCYLPHNKKYAFKKDWFKDVELMDFEDVKMPVPVEYTEILKRWFGEDYMEPKRYFDHTYPYFKNQEEALFEWYRNRGEIIPECFRE